MTDNDIIVEALGIIMSETHGDAYARELDKVWREQKAVLESESATKKEKDEAKRIQDALAKGLPAFASGLRDAIKGFQSGDPFAGSAAVMEICATLSSTLGAMTAAGGPPGAVVGALFSVVAMVLKMFVKPQKSLTSQIEEIIRTIKSESKIQKLHVAQQAIEAFLDTLTMVGQKWTLAEIEAKLNPIDGPAINAIRGAAEWLEQPLNQDLPLWGHVLAAQCQAYISLMEALTLGIASIDIGKLEDKGELSVAKLTAAFTSNNPIQLRFLQRIQPAARNRGIKWHIGRFSTGQNVESGALWASDTTKPNWKSHGGVMRVAAISRLQTNQRLDPNPYIAIFSLEQADTPWQRPEFSNRYRKNNRTYGMFGRWPLARNSGWNEIKELQGLYDICATPGEKEDEVYVYTANGKQIDRWIHNGAQSNDDGPIVQRSPGFDFWVADGDTVRSVCAVSTPRTVPGEDPGPLAGEKWVVYGGCEAANKELFINVTFSSGFRGRFPAGIMYGMKIDSRYLWTFSKEQITCISHTLVWRYCRHWFKDIFSEKSYYRIPAELKMTQLDHSFDGLLDLEPCDDGTLMAVFRKDGKRMYMATPSFGRDQQGRFREIFIRGEKKDNRGRTIPTNGWERLDEGEANRVYKQPIFCWPLIEALGDTLSRSKPQAAVTATA